ncbi:DUF3237 domain-containing protein [Devosia sp. Root635]|uniref:DUF3237 domain-containing protein n=1 Tax=Devosia sp. Root635 TaxID=1736575 RepID=UPI0006FAFC6E|nr:DUF3237 domain-containing protein [Devosia sp. Root635]KRA43264.1 hypothetical protein ASD80_08425 [Devosia sp. Root635]
MLDLKTPELRPFCTLEVEAGPARSLGTGRLGQRRIIPIVGGRVTGPCLNGRILPGGADWLTVNHDGVSLMDARYVLEADDGAIIEIVDQGFRHGPEAVIKSLLAGADVPSESYYMRSSIRLESGAPAYAHINRMVFVGTGAKTPSGVQIDIYSVE